MSAYEVVEKILQSTGGTVDSLRTVRSDDGAFVDQIALWRICYGSDKQGKQIICMIRHPPFNTAIGIEGVLVSFDGITFLVDMDVWCDHWELGGREF